MKAKPSAKTMLFGARNSDTHQKLKFLVRVHVVLPITKRSPAPSSNYIEGRLRTRKRQDNEGQDVFTTEVIADQMQVLGGRDDMGQWRQQWW